MFGVYSLEPVVRIITYKPYCQYERCLVCINWIIQVWRNMTVV